MKEIWREISFYPGKYYVSNLGRIKSLNRILKQQYNYAGYRVITIISNRIKKTYKVHNLVMINFIGNIPVGLQVNHKDGNKDNNCINNLEYITHLENIRHAFKNGLTICLKGEECGSSKLTNEEVLNIRSKYIPRGYSTRVLAREFNVSQHTIMQIIQRKTWAHI